MSTNEKFGKNSYKWFVMNIPFALGIAYIINGQGDYVEGVSNVVLAVTWFTIGFTPFLLTNVAVEAAAIKGQSRSVPGWLDIVFDICVFASFAYMGWTITAFFYAAHIVIGTSFWTLVAERTEKYKEGNNAENAL